MKIFETYPTLGNGIARLSNLLSGNCFAHHGIQRSGTNYLLRILIDLKLWPLNAFDPQRTNPKHKHFRWQSDKSSIKMHDYYKNDITPPDLNGLNSIAGYPVATKHLVIFKPPEPWLASIVNWGIACGWHHSVEEAANSEKLMDALGEYDAYYRFWQEIAEANRNRAVMLCYDDVFERPLLVADALDVLGIKYNSKHLPRNLGRYPEIKMSRANRTSYIDKNTRLRIKSVVFNYDFQFSGEPCRTNADYPGSWPESRPSK